MSQRRNLIRNVEGTTSIEFAFLAIPFVVLILGALQLFIVTLTQQMLETTTEALSRKILTGSVQQQALTKSQFATLACSLLPTVLDCTKLIVDVQVAGTFSGAVTTRPDLSAIGNPTSTTVLTYSTGVAGNIVVLRLLYALPVISLPGFNLQSSVSAYGFNFPIATNVFKNEIFVSS